jgi:hypothetical protein
MLYNNHVRRFSAYTDRHNLSDKMLIREAFGNCTTNEEPADAYCA